MCPGTCPYCGGTGTITEEYYNAERESMEQHESKCPALVEGTDEYAEANKPVSDDIKVLRYLNSTMAMVVDSIKKTVEYENRNQGNNRRIESGADKVFSYMNSTLGKVASEVKKSNKLTWTKH